MKIYSDEIRLHGENERVWVIPKEEAWTETGPETPSCQFFNLSGNSLSEPLVMAWDNVKKCLWLNVNVSEESFWKSGYPVQAVVKYSFEESNHQKLFYVTAFKDPWIASTCLHDLSQLSPSILLFVEEDGSINSDGLLKEAEDEIRLSLLSRGFAAGSVFEKPCLDQCHKYHALSLFHLYAAESDDSAHFKKHKAWSERYDQTFSRLLSKIRVDVNQDGVPNDKMQNLSGVRVLP